MSNFTYLYLYFVELGDHTTRQSEKCFYKWQLNFTYEIQT